MRPFHLAAACTALACIAPTAAAAAGSFTDPVDIDRAVERFISAAGGAAQPVDRRLRLAQCRAPLALFWHNARQDTVRVECPDQGSWRIFVSVRGGGGEAAAAKSQVLVSRGDAVSIQVRGAGFSVTQSGEAMEHGAQGDWIRVKPPGGADPLRAKVERPGLVAIPM
jgi:flagella basal body P-ring formation protein FlgA